MRFLHLAIAISILPLAAIAQEQLTLESILAQAREKNLALKVETAKLEAARANARGLNIPPPMLGYMKFTDQSGSSASGFEIDQTLPFPTKLVHDHTARNREAEAQEQESIARNTEIASQARQLYLNLWASQERRKFMGVKKDVLEGHVKLSRAGVRSDSFLRIHLLKAETDLDLLDNDLLAADQDIHEKQAALANFLDADPADFHPSLIEPALPVLPSSMSTTSPQTEAARLSLESFKARESEASSAWLPDIFFRYKSMGQTQLMPRTSEMMIGVSLPFFFPWEPAAASAKASAQREQSELESKSVNRKVGVDRQVLVKRAASLKKQLDNIQGKLLPRAEQRMKLVHNLAPRDMETLQDYRETMEAFPDLKLRSLDLRIRFEEAVAELAKYERGLQ